MAKNPWGSVTTSVLKKCKLKQGDKHTVLKIKL